MTGKIKLVHSGGNAVSITVPTSNPSSSEVEFKLPQADGSANQVLKTDGSGNLSFAADSGGKFASYAIIGDVKSVNTDGGTFTSGDWRTRDLNTEITDTDNIVSISSNQFTLAAGSYLIQWSCPGMRCGRHQSRLYDITGSASIQNGKSTTSDTGSDGDQNDSDGVARITISANNVYEIQHECSTTEATIGLGNAAHFGTEVYTLVKIFKEA